MHYHNILILTNWVGPHQAIKKRNQSKSFSLYLHILKTHFLPLSSVPQHTDYMVLWNNMITTERERDKGKQPMYYRAHISTLSQSALRNKQEKILKTNGYFFNTDYLKTMFKIIS